MEVKNSYIHNSQNINDRHQTWSDRNQGTFANENYKEASMFSNPEMPMETTEYTRESKKYTVSADALEELSENSASTKEIDLGAAIVAAGLTGATAISITDIDPQGIVLEPAVAIVAVSSIAVGSIVSLWYNSQNTSFPGPWTYTYQNHINNSPEKWDPKKTNWNDKVKLVKAIGAGGIAYQLHKKWEETSGDNLEKSKKK
ncbi:hypothetical protein [Flavobacterium sp. 140616W15]|uniref:hypothetical protein n=1 Tax=Flavobacterium sp. 140616W15 TaxID=2478552 RepID=UPI000F0C6B3A|nr:hypothetical protein [Flavobacterium sp. 140616W15]AYN04571.1 hypothetical protein EAG11_10645 [Flavobacterium sp. 140616W15]